MTYTLEQLEELSGKTTPGPWIEWLDDGKSWQILAEDEVILCTKDNDDTEYVKQAEVDFIIAARTALPELIARVRELEQMTTPRPIDEAPKDRYILVWHKSYSCWKGATWNEYFDAFCSSLGAVQTIGLGWVEAGGYPSVYDKASHWLPMPEAPTQEGKWKIRNLREPK